MKKFIASEFLWLLLTLALAIPLSFLWLISLDVVAEDRSFSEDEKIFVAELFLIAYAVCFVGIYLIRLVVNAIKALAKPPKE